MIPQGTRHAQPGSEVSVHAAEPRLGRGFLFRQDRIVNRVLAECRLILFEAEAPQPTPDVHSGVLNSAGAQSSFGETMCVKIAKDGLVYICDRANDRIQVFRKDGTFVKEFIVEKNTLRAGSVWDLDFLGCATQAPRTDAQITGPDAGHCVHNAIDAMHST
jgi:hypothetical protein